MDNTSYEINLSLTALNEEAFNGLLSAMPEEARSEFRRQALAAIWIKNFMDRATSAGLEIKPGGTYTAGMTVAEQLRTMFGEQLIDGLPVIAPEDYQDVKLSELYEVHNILFGLETALLNAQNRAEIMEPVALRGNVRRGVQSAAMQLFFDPCHSESEAFKAYSNGGKLAMRYTKNKNYVELTYSEETPLELRNANAKKEELEAFTATALQSNLAKLDEMAWDIATLAVTAFYTRTDGENAEGRFPILFDDYFDWRGVDPRKRSIEQKQQIQERIKLLADKDQMKIYTEVDLRLPDKTTGRNRIETVVTCDSLFFGATPFYRGGQSRLPLDDTLPDGYMIGLGAWASKYIEQRIMLGVYLRQLAQYDLSRQRWERRIGTYLVFQMQNQGTKMKRIKKSGTTQLVPQQPLKMKTVLDNSHIEWQAMAANTPGKVISQWIAALETLKADGVIGGYECQEGKADGSDHATRGRLEVLLERRFLIFPGEHQRPLLEAKLAAAEKARDAGRKRRAAAKTDEGKQK